MPDFKKATDLLVTPRSAQMIDKEDLKYLATKQGLEDLREDLRREFHDKIDTTHNETLNILDEIVTVVKRIDQERVFTFDYVKREADVDKNSRQIERIKDVLKIS
jgi:hypothetical protein